MSDDPIVTSDRADRSELKNTGYEIFIGILSILSILNLVLMRIVDDPDLDIVIKAMNGLLSVIFLVDFAYRLATAESKPGYLFKQYGWADFLASLPTAELKVLRIFRLVRVARLLRENGVRRIGRTLIKDRAEGALLTLLLLGVLVLEFGSLAVLYIEQDAEGANISSASDALWWVIVTISTVGYGDRFPVTNNGRILGAVIIVLGVAIFGTFTGYLANLFLAPKDAASDAGEPVSPDGDARAQLNHLKLLVAQQQSAIDELELLLPDDSG